MTQLRQLESLLLFNLNHCWVKTNNVQQCHLRNHFLSYIFLAIDVLLLLAKGDVFISC